MTAPGRDVTVSVEPGIPLRLTEFAAGPSGSSRVLLLHGLSQQRAFWNPVVHRMRTRPVAAVDQRGHGDSDTPVSADFSVAACGRDVEAVLDALEWPSAVIVGHSWGAAVALHAAAAHPDRATAVALIDGGLWTPADMGPREEVRARLTPPALGMPADALWDLIRLGDLHDGWSDERRAALEPTFVADAQGLLRTRLGMERHLRVLDGLLDHDGTADLDVLEEAGLPVWAAVCDGRASQGDPWTGLKDRAVRQAASRENVLVHRWTGAVHDVPLQWPALVAGFIDALAESREGGP